MKHILFLILAAPFVTQAQTPKTYQISRINEAPKINGIADEDCWKNINPVSDFVQYIPAEGKSAFEKTEVKMAYDNTAIYISAKLYDSHPDSIMKQLGDRDNYLTADAFEVSFDTYNNAQDAYDFKLTASGVQSESKRSDYNYNAVWESAAKITNEGWSFEMKIPFSAVRFPTSVNQIWGLQLKRFIARKNEWDQWALTPQSEPNPIALWGKLQGLSDIKAPLRLSLTPYLTTSVSHQSDLPEGNKIATSVSGGLGVKYGLNESFTLETTLLPDFSQVQSDDAVKNLSAFEQTYEEQRPFFQEGTELFMKGNIFYSRRIGKTPKHFYDVPYMLNANEKIIENPTQAKMLNATKISGRNNNGLGIGFLNSVLDNTYAKVEDEAGNQRKILTEPFSNYNIFVLDKQYKNSSAAYFINGNVIRGKGFDNANTSAAGFVLNNKKNTYGISANGTLSNQFSKSHSQVKNTSGFAYGVNLNKNSGKFRYTLYNYAANKSFNNNDIGITRETNILNTGFYASYNQYNPFWKFLNTFLYATGEVSQNLATKERNYLYARAFQLFTFKNYYSGNYGFLSTITEVKDYYEARTEGVIYKKPAYQEAFCGLESDSRKKLNAGLYLNKAWTAKYKNTDKHDDMIRLSANLNLRVNDKLVLSANSAISNDKNNAGFATYDTDGTAIFGIRDLKTISSFIYGKYNFSNKLSLGLRARHYWSTGDYNEFYTLNNEGYFLARHYVGNANFSYNAISIDSTLEWQFAPGSSLNLTWKNNITKEADSIIYNYADNFKDALIAPQQNVVSLKLLYYLDSKYFYHRVRV